MTDTRNYRTLNEVNDGCRALADAIILQAVKDYRDALKGNAARHRDEIELFFRSQWFGQLTEINPKMLIRKLKKEAETK